MDLDSAGFDRISCAESEAGRGNWPAAAAAWRDALDHFPELAGARRGLILALARLGRQDEALADCIIELAGQDGEHWLEQAIVGALEVADLSFAGHLASVLVRAQRGGIGLPEPIREHAARRFMTLPSLRHDIAQFLYLRDLGILGSWIDDTVARYRGVVARHETKGDNWRGLLSGRDEEEIGNIWGRIVHIDEGRRVSQALSACWSRDAAQRDYLEQRPGVVVIDDFLTEEALSELERFCLRSTIWFGNRYPDGRLGAFFFSGFNCPLLLQIAEELREALPYVIGPRYPLRQLWAFKNTGVLPANSTIHADFAAVNVNFWITPTDANLDPLTGGMLIYDLEAPGSWDFSIYNEGIEVIRSYIAARRPREIRIPYRRNRLVLFNSDLFHATEAVRFCSEYISHRINVTLLYGDRQQDAHHPPQSDEGPGRSSWRSPAFSRNRRHR